MSNLKFNSYEGIKLTAGEVVSEVIDFMNQDPDCAYKVMIGTDSKLYEKTKADFVTAVVVHRLGNGGRYFWRRKELTGFHTLRDRMVREALMSLDIAKEILVLLKQYPQSSTEGEPALGWSFEIHIDIGQNGETKVMIQELVGMIRANNFEVRTKPESYAASSVADKHI